MNSSEIDINNLRELHAATTQGEWYNGGIGYLWASQDESDHGLVARFTRDSDVCYCGESEENIDFTVVAHKIWPALLDELERLRAYRDDMHKLVEGVDVVCLRGDNDRLQQQVADLMKACEQYQEHSREMTTACARLRGENELRQEAAVVSMEERDELRNALQELLDFSDVLQGRHFVMSNQVRENAGKLLKQHTETE